MTCHNSCFVVGNLGMDPIEKSRGEKFGPVVKFTIAENVVRFDENTKSFETVHTNWFSVTAFGQLAEKAKAQLKKGNRVIVQGRMKVTKFTDRSGEERSGFEILADEVAIWKSLSAGKGDTESLNKSCNSPIQDERSSRNAAAAASHRPVSSHGNAASRARTGAGAHR